MAGSTTPFQDLYKVHWLHSEFAAARVKSTTTPAPRAHGTMNNTLPKLRPPITQLRPLHSLQQPSNREFELPRLREEAHLENSIHLVHWSSPLEPKPDKETAIKAFVRLVARIAVIEVGDKYCIEDAERGGFILAHSAGQVHEEGDSGFVDCLDGQVIPTDFSIGEGKVCIAIRATLESHRVLQIT